MQNNKFEQFLKNRQSLIDQYTKGDLTKDEFIRANYQFINSIDIKPFQRVDNEKKAIYNYQYYNVLAKYYQKMAHNLKKSHQAREEYFELADHYYFKKDQATEKLLKIIDFRGVEAYFVRVKSPNLKKKLFEMVFEDFDNLVLHSKNEHILQMLKEENVFSPEIRDSVVDSYINQKY